jgi:hypothetical protein
MAWPPVHRITSAAGVALGSTQLPDPSHLVRILDPDTLSYERMIVVTERDEGGELVLSGWIGSPLTLREWRAAKQALFPQAEIVSWERRRGDGSMHFARLYS